MISLSLDLAILRDSSIESIKKIKLADTKVQKTKEFKKLTKKLKVDSALIVNDKFDENLFLSSRNIKNMEYSEGSSINPVSLMKYEKVIINVELFLLSFDRSEV